MTFFTTTNRFLTFFAAASPDFALTFLIVHGIFGDIIVSLAHGGRPNDSAVRFAFFAILYHLDYLHPWVFIFGRTTTFQVFIPRDVLGTRLSSAISTTVDFLVRAFFLAARRVLALIVLTVVLRYFTACIIKHLAK